MKKIKYKKIYKYLIVLLAIEVVITIGLFIAFLNKMQEEIVLKGQKEIEVEVFSNYQDLGYDIYTNKKQVIIVIDNSVNTNVLGTYYVTYTLDKKSVKRKVNVVDKQKPVITLKGKEEVFVCSNKTYQEEGYKAIDNYDKDITDKVEITKNKEKIIYTVKDSSNNKTEIIRKIIYEDREKPSIKFKDNLVIYQGNKFIDDVKGIDNCDGDITKNIKISGSIDTKTIGIYKIKYTLTDKSNNKEEKERVIKVVEKPKNKSIYLTFDDGPSKNITPKILDLLKKYNIKATFFVINHDDSLNNIIKRVNDEGHTVALHSYTHNYSKIYKSDDAYFKDLKQIEDKVISITGKSSKIIRFPGGSSNTISKNYSKGIMTRLTKEVEKKGYIYQDWNVGSSDTSTQNPNKICNNVKKRLTNTYNIVLMHDTNTHNGTYESLSCIIEYGLNNGYSFYALDKNSPISHHNVAN